MPGDPAVGYSSEKPHGRRQQEKAAWPVWRPDYPGWIGRDAAMMKVEG